MGEQYLEEIYFSAKGEIPVAEQYTDPSPATLRDTADTLDRLEDLETLFATAEQKLLKRGEAEELLDQGYEADEHVLWYRGDPEAPRFVDAYVIGDRLETLDDDIGMYTDRIVDTINAVTDDGERSVNEAVNQVYCVIDKSLSGDGDARDALETLRDESPQHYETLDRYSTAWKRLLYRETTLDRYISRNGMPQIDGLFDRAEDMEHFIDNREKVEADGDTLQDALETAPWAKDAYERGRALARVAVDRRDRRVNDEESVAPFAHELRVALTGDEPDGRGIN